ncbi:cytochrome P450 [Streptomyces paromomycinus]|uniref:Cytochrome P450 n=1 Tax=Streptomyces paromomycinus TaxID=92743 RepID=A0A401VV21_STREY|nr:cytochrome P450 [Streptomyces paromomycinus]GCD40922.1 cytochrome P450 [Streptomyces paromomycinus]
MTQPQEIPVHLRRDRFDPVPELRQQTRKAPLTAADIDFGPLGQVKWLATGDAEVREVLGDLTRFSSALPDGEDGTGTRALPGNLLTCDPPDHTRLRKMVAPEFTARRTRRLEPRLHEIVAECLNTLERVGPPADFMRHFAWPMAGLITCELLGIPRDDRAELARYLDVSQNDAGSPEQQTATGKAYWAYMVTLAGRQRRDPGDGLFGSVVRAHGADISDEELAGLGATFVSDGFLQVSSMLGLGTLALLDHPDQLALLRERPELIDRAVEELLRYVTVIHTVAPRTAREDVAVGGHVIKAGERVACSLFAVNRAQDEAETDRFDITREAAPHMAFGYGIHHCVAAPLVKREMAAVYPALLRKFPGLRLAVPPEEVRFRGSQTRQFSLEALPVAW